MEENLNNQKEGTKHPLTKFYRIVYNFALIFSFEFLIFSFAYTFTSIAIWQKNLLKKYNVSSNSIYSDNTISSIGQFSEIKNSFIYTALSTNFSGINLSTMFNIGSTEPVEPENFNVEYDITPAGQLKGSVRIPVLLYHHINQVPSSVGERILNVPPEMFRQQMQYLKDKKYKTLTEDEFYKILEQGSNPKQKSVLISFDDGYEDTYSQAFPILKEFGFKATLFIPVDKKELTNAEIKEMSDYGLDIESHTLSHQSLTQTISQNKMISEIYLSRDKLSAIINKPVDVFAYPYCVYNNTNLNLIKHSSYKIAFKCGSTNSNSIDHFYNSRFELYRSWMYNDMRNFMDRLSGIEYRPADKPPVPDKNFHFKVLGLTILR